MNDNNEAIYRGWLAKNLGDLSIGVYDEVSGAMLGSVDRNLMVLENQIDKEYEVYLSEKSLLDSQEAFKEFLNLMTERYQSYCRTLKEIREKEGDNKIDEAIQKLQNTLHVLNNLPIPATAAP